MTSKVAKSWSKMYIYTPTDHQPHQFHKHFHITRMESNAQDCGKSKTAKYYYAALKYRSDESIPADRM